MMELSVRRNWSNLSLFHENTQKYRYRIMSGSLYRFRLYCKPILEEMTVQINTRVCPRALKVLWKLEVWRINHDFMVSCYWVPCRKWKNQGFKGLTHWRPWRITFPLLSSFFLYSEKVSCSIDLALYFACHTMAITDIKDKNHKKVL